MKTNKKCIYCGDFIYLNSDEIKMIENGELSFNDFQCCDDCAENQNREEDFFAGYDSEW